SPRPPGRGARPRSTRPSSTGSCPSGTRGTLLAPASPSKRSVPIERIRAGQTPALLGSLRQAYSGAGDVDAGLGQVHARGLDGKVRLHVAERIAGIQWLVGASAGAGPADSRVRDLDLRVRKRRPLATGDTLHGLV